MPVMVRLLMLRDQQPRRLRCSRIRGSSTREARLTCPIRLTHLPLALLYGFEGSPGGWTASGDTTGGVPALAGRQLVPVIGQAFHTHPARILMPLPPPATT